ncbi:MAG: DUF1049 domain-containing protein [Erythrobacter sp.]|nr:DUF1049 domain-containing protein [Erythrobacter sp.]
MQILRTLLWVLILALVLVFSWANWDERVTVNIWSNLVWDTRLPALVIVSFMLGHLPMWLYSRGQRWSLGRRIRSLEQAVKSSVLARQETSSDPAAPGPSAGDGPA